MVLIFVLVIVLILPPTAVLEEQTVVELVVLMEDSPGDYEDQTTREDAVIESDQVAELECIRFSFFSDSFAFPF